MGLLRSASMGLFALLVAVLAPAVVHLTKIGGPFYTPNPTVLSAGQGPIFIEDTVHCEDLHYYRPANLLFTACEDRNDTRFRWFPGLANLDITAATGRGSIHVVDPQTFKSTRLELEDFNGPYITHGIDVIQDPQDPAAVYIFAINHLPNPEFTSTTRNVPEARSQIELFHHVLHSPTAQHVRSILHPLLQTPNDIYADSPNSLYVTNDHFYRSGPLRLIEDAWPAAKWSNIIHIQLHELHDVVDATSSLTASVAHSGLWNNNGLGHVRSKSEIVIASAIGAELFLGTRHENNTISVHDTIAFDSAVDNPSYYIDPYASAAHDASGFVVGGLSKGFYLPQTCRDPAALDPVQVRYAKTGSGEKALEQRLLFEDDGRRIRSASSAVLVPIEPENGVKKAWLFVTGFVSQSMIAVKVEL